MTRENSIFRFRSPIINCAYKGLSTHLIQMDYYLKPIVLSSMDGPVISSVPRPVIRKPAASRPLIVKYPQSRHWIWTLNNYTPQDLEALALSPIMDYLVYGKEIGMNKTPHLQGYVVFKTKRRRTTIMNSISKRCWCQVMQTSPEQASNYCKKDGDFYEFGTIPRTAGQATSQRNKKNWDEAYNLAKSGDIEQIEVYLTALLSCYQAYKARQSSTSSKA